MMNKKKMKRLTVVLVICTMLMNGIAVFPVSAEEAILPETVNEEPAAVETAPAEEPTEEEPAAEEPATEEPIAEEPAAEKTAAGKPAAKKSEAKETPAAANNAPAAEEPAEDVKEFSVMFANGNAIIYANPEANNGYEIGSMQDGEAIEVCEINQDWYEVKTGGYIMKGSLRYEAEKKIAEEPAVIETKTVTEKTTEEKGSDEETPAADVPAAETPAAEDPADKETLTGTPSEDEAEGEQVYTWMLVNGSATIYAKPEAAAENAICEIQDGTPIKACVYDENWYKVKDGYIMKADVCTEAEQPDQDKSPVFSGSTLISEEDIPDDSILIGQILDEMDESRSIDVYISFEGENVSFLDTVTLYAVLRGYDNCTFTVQWQQSPNGNDWTDITGENGLKYTFVVTEDNYELFWRLAVHIVSIEIPDEMLEQANIQE